MRVQLITPPATEPITLAELKLHLRLDSGSFADNIDEIQSVAPGSYGIDYELLTLDVAPGGIGWTIGNTLTGQTSNKTCVIVTVLTTKTYIIKNRSGTFTFGEVITNGVDIADQGAAYPIFTTGYTILGTAVEVLGHTTVVNLISGTNAATGTLDVKIQESDDNVIFTDWTGGAFTQITTFNDNATYEKAYLGIKRYIRTVAKVLLAACEFGTLIIRLTATAIEDDLLNGIITAAREHVEDITRRQLITATWEYYLDKWPHGDAIVLPFGNLQKGIVTSLIVEDNICTEADGTYNLIFTGDCTTSATGTYTILTNVIIEVTIVDGGNGYSAIPIVATQSGEGSIIASIIPIVTYMDSDGITTTMIAGTDYIIETNGDQCGRLVLPYNGTWPSITLHPSNPIIIKFNCGWTTAALVPYKIKSAMKLICADLYKMRGDPVIGQSVTEVKTIMRLLQSARLWNEFT